MLIVSNHRRPHERRPSGRSGKVAAQHQGGSASRVAVAIIALAPAHLVKPGALIEPAGGGIAFIASVAGYRGLPKSVCYGPGKAALIHFAECLHLDLADQGIGIWLINPGFVQTRLTAQNDFSMPALLTPDQAAVAIVDGFRTVRFEIHFPKRFTLALKLVSLLPYRWYFPLIRRITGA